MEPMEASSPSQETTLLQSFRPLKSAFNQKKTTCRSLDGHSSAQLTVRVHRPPTPATSGPESKTTDGPMQKRP